MYGITGTPGTGKSSVGTELSCRGYQVIHLVDTIQPYIIEQDRERGTAVVDEERWAKEFIPIDGFVEGHLAHYLPCDLIIVLRCRPDVLEARLRSRGYAWPKIRENAESEAMDLILSQTAVRFGDGRIHEIDTTHITIQDVTDQVERVITGADPLVYGTLDWSEYLEYYV
ncbi:MAG: adenylate kinase family protein [Methanomicrobiales archaeon]|nr:adenylate kinase family protein [Methanomicrobiales archaeon]